MYVDALVLRDRDANNYSGDGLEERLYVAQDANWNVTALINTFGSAVERVAYDPYGKPMFFDGSGNVPKTPSAYDFAYLHQGLRLDSIVDLYDNRARAYSATLMRFLQNDPIGFAAGDGNTYRYETNKPTSGLDSGGLQVCDGSPLPYRSWQDWAKDWARNEMGSPREPLWMRDPLLPSGTPITIQNVTIEMIKRRIWDSKCCPLDKKREAVKLINDLITMAQFEWNKRTGLFGNCEEWMNEYWKHYQASKLPQEVAKLSPCITSVRKVGWDNDGFGALLIGAGMVAGAVTGGLSTTPCIGLGIDGIAGAGPGSIALAAPPGHNAIEIKLCDGYTFYLDDGNFGQSGTHIFVGLPAYYRNYRPID